MRKEFKQAVLEVSEKEWKPIRKKVNGKWDDTGQEWAEVCYVPNKGAISKKDPVYRYLATRELLKEQMDLEGLELEQKELPFPTMELGSKGKYKIYGIVTNRDLPGEELILWYRKRCGKSEEVHAVMKEDLAGGKLPSGKFGANAAWWQIMILALNINQALKRLVLGKSWEPKRMKAIRYHIINVAGHRLSTGGMEEVLADHPDVAECAVLGVDDQLKGQVPIGFLVLNAGVEREPADIIKEVIQMVRDRIGPVASFRTATVVKRLPKTRSGKILRGTIQKIADNKPYKAPATIEDPAVLDEMQEALNKIGYAKAKK